MMNATAGMTLGTDSVSSAANRAHNMVDSAADKAASAADKASPAIQSAATAAHQTIDKVATAGTSAAEWAAANTKQLVSNGTQLVDACGGYVRARPLVSVAGALTLGYFIGRMLR
jgi:ElaB/YqjD/DUF883 family membrane-anchored ribosome-binding protein